ncbi:ABC transporter ATP-binding protein [Anaerococcus sp. DFU013_CI05]|uniref:ABC transporter ATP-binding protein n=1 Tax=unclassified Anaerococcus TaxID=2614126 RepID=UPI001933B26D|nr:ABC transporter ATP-binding protein [Anaerococcus sp. mt242]MBM0045778.1 ABC transporter ATP-binding protein [Anaerococcus sp. mt242]
MIKRDNFSLNLLKSYAKKQQTAFIKGFLFSFSRTILEIISPLIIGYLINNVIKEGMDNESIKIIIWLLIIYFLVNALAGFFLNKTFISFEVAANNVAFDIQNDVYKKVNSFPISYFDNLPAGKISSRITNDTNKVKNMFRLIFSDIVTAFILIVGLIVVIFATNPIAGLMLLILSPLVYIITKSYTGYTRKYTGEIRKSTSEINAKINEYIQNMELIQVYNKENYIKDKFNETNNHIFSEAKKLAKLRSYSGFRAMDIVSYIASIIILIYFGLGQLTQWYEVSIGSLYVIFDYTTRLFDEIRFSIMRFGEVQESIASANHIFELLKLDSQEELTDSINSIDEEIIFDNVRFSYIEGEEVIKGMSFKVDKGESIAFVGQTGSGKSTLINLLLNFYKTDSGKITIGGKDISKVNRDQLRKDMAVVLQDAFLFKADIAQNITLGLDFSDEEIKESLIAVGGQRLIDKGIHSEVLENGSNLSQGEKQLISFARAYIRNPKILILDEATSNIDTETETIIQDGINKLKENRTTFIIAHRLSTIKDVDNIIVLSYGKIVESGNHDTLIASNGYYKEMYDKQIKENQTL